MGKDVDNNLSTKDRILKAAEETFAEKGYDAASVSEIAKRAGISKTQIFYYFENKKDLLNELIKDCMSSIIPYKNTLWGNVNQNSKNEIVEFIDSLAKILETKRDIIRIGLLESFKNMPNDISIFEILDPIFKDSLLKFKNQNTDSINEDIILEYSMNMIFHIMIPLYSYYILSEKFNNYYNIDSEKTRKIFFKTFNEIFIKYMLGQ